MEMMKRFTKRTLYLLIVLISFSTIFNVRYDKQSSSFIITNIYADASKIKSPLHLQHDYETWGVFFRGSPVPHDFTKEGKLVPAKPSHGCSKLTNEDKIRGNVVMIDSNDCDPQEKAKNAQKAGAKAVIIAEYQWHPALTYMTDGKDHPDLKIPTVQMKAKDFQRLKKLALTEDLVIEVTPDPNPWDQTYGNRQLWDAHMAFVVVGFAIVIAIALYKIYLYWKNEETARTKLAILILVTLYSAVVVLGWVDVIGTMGIWSYQVSTLLSSAYFPFGLTTYFLLALYWGSIARGVVPDFANVKKPFMIMAPVFFLVEFGSWVPRYMLYNTEMILSILLALYIVGFACATVFYVFNGVKIIKIIFYGNNEFLANNPEVTPQLKKMTGYILAIAACNAMMVLMFIVYMGVGIGPITNTCIYWIHAALMLIIAFSEVQMFPDVPKKPAEDLPMVMEMDVMSMAMNATKSDTLSFTFEETDDAQ